MLIKIEVRNPDVDQNFFYLNVDLKLDISEETHLLFKSVSFGSVYL